MLCIIIEGTKNDLGVRERLLELVICGLVLVIRLWPCVVSCEVVNEGVRDAIDKHRAILEPTITWPIEESE